MEDNKDSKEKTDSKYNYFEEPLLFKNFRKNPININGTWNVVYVVNNKVKPDSIWEADYHVSNNFVKQGENTYLTNDKVNTINSFLDTYFPFVNPVYVQKDAVVYDKIILPTTEPATNSLDWTQIAAKAPKKPSKEFERVVLPQYRATPKPVDVDLAYTTLVDYPAAVMVEPAIENFIQVSWKKPSSWLGKGGLLGDCAANLDRADVGICHYPQILDIAFNKPIVNVNSILDSDLFPAIIDVKPSDCITDPFILDVVDDVLASQEDEEIAKTYPTILDIAFNKPVVKTSSNVQSEVYPHIIDVKPSDCIDDPFILDVIDDVLAAQEETEEVVQTYPEVLDIAYNKPVVKQDSTVKTQSYPVQMDIQPSDCITDPLVWDLVDDILASQTVVVNETYPQILDLGNLQTEPTPVLVSEPSDVCVEFNIHEFEKEHLKPSYPLTIQLDRSCEVSDPFVLGYAKQYNKEHEAKKQAEFVETYPQVLSVEFKAPEKVIAPAKPQLSEPEIMDIEFEIPSPNVIANEKPQATLPEVMDIEFEVPATRPVSTEELQPTYPEIMDVVPSDHMIDPFVLHMLKEQKASFFANNIQETYPMQVDLYNVASNVIAKREANNNKNQPVALCYPDIINLVLNRNDLIDDPLIKTVVVEKEIMVPVEKKVYIPVEINKPYEVIKEVNVPIFVDKPVFVDKPIEIIKDEPVEITKEVIVEKEVPQQSEQSNKSNQVESAKESSSSKSVEEPKQDESNQTKAATNNKEQNGVDVVVTVQPKNINEDKPVVTVAQNTPSHNESEEKPASEKTNQVYGKPVTSKCIKVPTNNTKTPLPIDFDTLPVNETENSSKEVDKPVEKEAGMTTPVAVDVKPATEQKPAPVEVKPSEATKPEPVAVKPVETEKPTPESNPQIIEVTPVNKQPVQQQVQIPTQTTTGTVSPINLTINVNYGEPVNVRPVQQSQQPTEKTPNFTIEQSAPAIPQMENVKPNVQEARLLESHPEVKVEKKTEIKVEEPKKVELPPPLVQEPIIIDKTKEVEVKAPVEEVEDAFDELDDEDEEEEKTQKVYKPYITLYNGNRPMSSEHMVNRYGLDKKQLGKVEQKPKNLKVKQSKAKTAKTAKATSVDLKKK